VERHAPKVDLLELKRAVKRRRVLVIDYEALNGARTTRTVRLLSVNFFGPVWLLAAWCELGGLQMFSARSDRFPDAEWRNIS
jgi:predicted DNA-binding transcriptional regulator YafY